MKKTRNFFWITLIITLVILQTVPIQAKEKSISMKQKKISLYIGKTKRLSLKKKTSKDLIWSSSNKKVARVSQRGLVRAIGKGTAKITVKIKDSKKNTTCKVSVGEYASELKLYSATSVILEEGSTSKIKAGVVPKKVLTKGLTYVSMDSKIAIVDKKGTITAVSQGLTQIIVATKAIDKKGNPIKKTIQVVVQKAKEEESSQESNVFPDTSTEDTEKALINVTKNGTLTNYTLNKSYVNDITVSMSVNGKIWNYTGTVSGILSDLNTTYTTRTNADGTICVTRNMGDEYWTVTNPSNENALLFRVKAEVTSDENREYGSIVIEQIGAEVEVSVY